MSTHSTVTADDELVGLIHRALEKAGGPLSASTLARQIPKPFKRDARALTAVLDDEAARGRLHRLVRGKSTSYGQEPAEAVARRELAGAVSDAPKTWSDLKKGAGLKAAAKWLTSKQLDALRDDLLREGRFYEWPKTGGKGAAVRYSTRPADPRAYLDKALAAFRKDLAKLAMTLAKAGVTPADVERAAREALAESPGVEAPAVPQTPARPDVRAGSDVAALIVDRMVLEDPAAATGAPVSLRNLRRAVAFLLPDGTSFDDAVVRLAEEGTVSLHRHDYPAGLTDGERAEMVSDGRGGYYTAISVRS